MVDQIHFEEHRACTKDNPIMYSHDEVHQTADMKDINLHENIEILFVTGGTGAVFNWDRIVSVETNDVVICNSKHPHAVASATAITYDVLIVSRDFLFDHGIDTSRTTYRRYISGDTFLCCFFTRLNEVYQEQSEYVILKVKAMVLFLFAYLSERYVVLEQETSSGAYKMSLAISYIMKNLTAPLNLDEIANAAGYSKYYFLRRFKALTGRTPLEFINHQRCEYARTLLINTNASVSEISSAVGYDNPAYFTRIFGKFAGCSPTRFAMEHKKDKK